MNGLFKGSFDPITICDLQYAENLRKEKKLNYIFFVLEEDATVDYKYRLTILKRMIKSYRKFKILTVEKTDNCYLIQQENKQIQQAVRNGNFKYIPKYIRSYIMENGLYCQTILKNKLKEKRYLHSLSVAELSIKIAIGNNLDSKMAYLIGIYHDIAKNLSSEDNNIYISIYKPYEMKYDENVWHQYIGYYLLKHYYCLHDKTILKAIRHHCLGDDKSIYSQLIFVADKLDPSRGYDSTKQIEISVKNLQVGFEIVKQQNRDFLKKEGINNI